MSHVGPVNARRAKRSAKHLLIYGFIALLSACGSQEGLNTDVAGVNAAATAAKSVVISAEANTGITSSLLTSLDQLYPNGQLPASRTAQAAQAAAQNPTALLLTSAPHDSITSAVKQQKTDATLKPLALSADYQPVQRVQNTTLYGAYFFSIYPTEIATALATNPKWRLEGPAFWASLATGTDLYPVHRFRNKTNGSYLYSIYETERADIVTNYSATFAYEGVAWYARQTAASGWSALYRFRNKTNGTYLFSAYESEKNAIVANYPDVFVLEGIAYYVRQDAPVDSSVVPPVVPSSAYKLPDTGITSSQCYKAGSDVLSSCAPSQDPKSAYELNKHQDGMVGLDVTAPAAADGKLGFSYSDVPNPAGGMFPKTDCVKDNLTGLMWEGKPTTGPRRASFTYTNYDSTTALQKPSGSAYIAPTQADIDATTNSVGYKNGANAYGGICGYTDWRLPTPDELQTIVDYGVSGQGSSIDATWFPNTAGSFWTASSHQLEHSAWIVGQAGFILVDKRSATNVVRLVRGLTPAKQYVISPNGQEVTDTRTGLVWQRCVVGMDLFGSACTRTATLFNHEAALVQATSQSNATGVAWRLPNIKEYGSIFNPSKQSQVLIDTVAFPDAPAGSHWSSTPFAYNPSNNCPWFIDFSSNGGILGSFCSRSTAYYVRLVRFGP